jgi:hypothetical protein
LFEGQVPSCFDGADKPVVFATRVEAEFELMEFTIDRVEEFLAGERDLDDALNIEEFVVPVEVLEDGTVRQVVEG